MRFHTIFFIILNVFFMFNIIGCTNQQLESENTNNIEINKQESLYELTGAISEINIHEIDAECDCVLEEDLTKGVIKIQSDKESIVVINNKTKIFKNNKEIDIKDLQLDDVVEVEFKSFVEDNSINQGIANIINLN